MPVVINNTFLHSNLATVSTEHLTTIHPIEWPRTNQKLQVVKTSQPHSQIPDNNRWLLPLVMDKEPVTNLTFGSSEIKVLWDTGSDWSAIASSTLYKILPDWKNYVEHITFNTLGPDNRPILCYGKISLDFDILGNPHSDSFLVIHSEFHNALIGYNFMKAQGITICAGKYLTNSRQSQTYLRHVNHIVTKMNNIDIPHKIPLIIAHTTEIYPGEEAQLPLEIPMDYKKWIPLLQYTIAPAIIVGTLRFYDIPIDASGTVTVPFKDDTSNFSYTLDKGSTSMALLTTDRKIVINNLVTPHSMVTDVIDTSADQMEIDSLEFSLEGIHYPRVESTSDKVIMPLANPSTITIDVATNCHPCSACKDNSFTMCDTTNATCALHINNIPTSHNRHCLFHLYQCTDRRNMIFVHCNDCYILRGLLEKYWTRSPIAQALFSYFLVNQSIVLFVEGSSLCTSEKRILLAKKIHFLSRKYYIYEIYLTGHCHGLKTCIDEFHDINPITIDTLTGDTSNSCRLHPITNTQLRNMRKLEKTELEASIYTKDEEMSRQLATVIQSQATLFAKDTFDIGTWAKDGIPYQIHIRLLDNTPIVHKFRPIHHSKLKQATEIMQGLRNAGIISRQVTNWSSNAVWALKAVPMMTQEEAAELNIPYVPGVESRKATRPLRLTIDLRELNTKVCAPACILPNVKSIFSEIRNSEILTILDLVQAYFCLSYSKESARITGFNCGIPDEQLHVFTRTVMGLRSSQAALTSALFHTIGSLRQFVFSYSDNLVIHSDRERHTEVVNKVLDALRTAGFKISLSKSIFAITGDVKIFGLIYNPTSKLIAPDQNKMRSLASLKPPSSFTQLKAFLGSVNFVINHLEGIGDHMATLFALTRDNKEFQWTTEAQHSYDEILKAINNHQKLYVLDYNHVAILSIDSSAVSAGGILAQIHPQTGKFMVNSYYQKIFSVSEGKLMNFEREALGLISIYKMAANTVFGCPLIIVSDCRAVVSLKYLANQSHKVSRWMSILEAHIPSIKFIHLKNTSDLVRISDYISRTPPYRASEVALSEDRYTPAPAHLKDRRATAQDADKIDTLTAKVDKGIATIVDYDIVLDYLLSLTDVELMSIDDETVLCDSGFVIFRRSGNSPEKVEVRQRLKPYRPLDQISLYRINTQTSNDEHSITITHPSDDDLPFHTHTQLLNIQAMMGDSLNPTTDTPLRFLQYFTIKFPHIDINNLIELQKQDPQCRSIFTKCTTMENLEWKKNDKNTFLIRQGILLHQSDDANGRQIQLYIPSHMVFDVINTLHRMYAHPGANKLLKLFTTNFYAPGIQRHVRNLLSQCYFCAVNKPAAQYKRPLFQHTVHKSLKGPGVLFSTDVIKISNNVGSINSLLTFTCCFSLYTIVYPIAHDLSSQGFIDILVNCFLPTINFSASFLLMDNAPYFTSNMTKQALRQLNIHQVTICPYSPSNNPSERLQKQLLTMIKITIQEKCMPTNAWPKIVQYITTIMNSTPFTNVIFTLSPADLFFGRKCHPFGLIPFLTFNDDEASATPLADDMGKTRRILHKFTTELAKIRQRFYEKEHANINDAGKTSINPGDLVAMLDMAQNLNGYNRKLRPRFKKLFWVVHTTPTAAFCRPTTSQNKDPDDADNAPLIKIEKRLLKKLKPTVLFPVESKIFNSNFQHMLPEPMDFFYHEDFDSSGDTYLQPDEFNDAGPEDDEKDYTPITVHNVNIRHTTSLRRAKKVHFSPTVHCVTLHRTTVTYAVTNLAGDRNTAITETFFN